MQITRIKRINPDEITKENYLEKIKIAKNLTIEFFTKKKTAPKELVKIIDIYQQAIDLIPNRAEAYLSLAYITWKIGQYNEAIALLKTVKKISPLDSNADEMIKTIEKEYKNKQILEKRKTSLNNKNKLKNNTLHNSMSKIKRS
ncbi:MAG: tetratricopeptide repeat protein [Candidatus Sericytochromatia bacterium]